MIWFLYASQIPPLMLLLWRGDRLDRLAGALAFLAAIVEPLLTVFTIATWQAGSALLNLALLIGLCVIMLRADRHWLIWATACQLLVVATYIYPLFTDALLLWSTMSIRLVLWCAINVLMALGAFEAWADEIFERENRANGQSA